MKCCPFRNESGDCKPALDYGSQEFSFEANSGHPDHYADCFVYQMHMHADGPSDFLKMEHPEKMEDKRSMTMKQGFCSKTLDLETYSCELNIGDEDGVRENYEDLVDFAQRVPPGFPMYIEHAVMDAMHVLAVIFPIRHEDGGFPSRYTYPTITRWMNRKGSFKAYFADHSFYSGTGKLKEYCRRVDRLISSKFIPG